MPAPLATLDGLIVLETMAALVILDVLKNPVPDEYESPNVTTMPLYVAVSQSQGCHRIGEHQQHGWLGNQNASKKESEGRSETRALSQ